jgi:hypothetical protein
MIGRGTRVDGFVMRTGKVSGATRAERCIQFLVTGEEGPCGVAKDAEEAGHKEDDEGA